MVDMVAVPHRLEDAVGKAQYHYVLNRLLAEEMVHPIDLGFRQHTQDLSIQRAGRGEIAAERLFDDDTPETAAFFLHEADGAELLDNGTEQLATDGKIKDRIVTRLVQCRRLFVDLVEASVSVGLRDVAREMSNPARDELPCLRVELLGRWSRSGI